MDNISKIKGIAILAFSALTSWLGALAVPLLLLITCNIIDYITGIIAAPLKGRRRNSKTGFSGIVKKVCSWLLVVVGMIIDTLLDYLANTAGWHLPFGFAVATIVCIWLLANELLSVVENIGCITGEVPPFLRPIITWVKKNTEDNNNNRAAP